MIMLAETIEWLGQSEYDFETAQAMYKTQRYVYAIFMCHLALEKLLKAFIIEKTKETPPRTHNLLMLLNMIALEMPIELKEFLATLNMMSVTTRYPENLAKTIQEYSPELVSDYILKTEETLQWLKKKLAR
jgi:HEPN domain-containing protein